jgi:hypothetical protein
VGALLAKVLHGAAYRGHAIEHFLGTEVRAKEQWMVGSLPQIGEYM